MMVVKTQRRFKITVVKTHALARRGPDQINKETEEAQRTTVQGMRQCSY